MAEVNLGAAEATVGFTEQAGSSANCLQYFGQAASCAGQTASCVSQVGWQALVCVRKVTAAILGCSR